MKTRQDLQLRSSSLFDRPLPLKLKAKLQWRKAQHGFPIYSDNDLVQDISEGINTAELFLKLAEAKFSAKSEELLNRAKEKLDVILFDCSHIQKAKIREKYRDKIATLQLTISDKMKKNHFFPPKEEETELWTPEKCRLEVQKLNDLVTLRGKMEDEYAKLIASRICKKDVLTLNEVEKKELLRLGILESAIKCLAYQFKIVNKQIQAQEDSRIEAAYKNPSF